MFNMWVISSLDKVMAEGLASNSNKEDIKESDIKVPASTGM